MNTINIVLAVHNHQPIGNFSEVFELAYQLGYRPFIDVLERHPAVKFTQHYTGPLLEWIAEKHPEFIERMKGMVQRGQLELLTGAFYEPILPVIPEEDRIGQIKKLTATIRELFGVVPRGMWLAERVWEQQLASSLAKAGVEFVMVDDTHFRHAGLRDDQLLSYYVTEEQGDVLNVLPIDKMLRYTIPFRALPETFDYFHRVASADGKRLVIHADDGEKFGVWPKTNKTVYEDGWLESFCRMLEHESSWAKTIHAGTAIDLCSPAGRIYLPSASYAEMMKWALDSTSFMNLERFELELKERDLYAGNSMFVRGGYWRNFLARYPEANHMHKKMLRIANRMRAAGASVPLAARDALWAAQCNDPYWHGVFGGLYLPNLRDPVYRNLLTAEEGLDGINPRNGPMVEETDFDCDGHTELVVESKDFDMCFTPDLGATMVEFSVKPYAVNLLDILSRREEGYHRRLREAAEGHPLPGSQPVEVKEAGLEQHLFFDWYRHGSLVDHFFGEGTNLGSVTQCRYPELGDFVNQPYTVRHKCKGSTAEMTFERNGAIWRSGVPWRITVSKTVRLKEGDSGYTVEYLLTNNEAEPIDLWFGIEWCIGALAGDAPDRAYEVKGHVVPDSRLRSSGEEDNVTSFALVDGWRKLRTSFDVDVPATVWRFPIETVSLSEGGFERIYQGSVAICHWRVKLEGKKDARGDRHTFRIRAGQTVTGV